MAPKRRSQAQIMNLQTGNINPEKQRRQMVTKFLEHHLNGAIHLTSTLELFNLFTVPAIADPVDGPAVSFHRS